MRTGGSVPPSRPPSSSRSSACPALRPRRRAPVDGDRTLERRPLRRDRPGVVARVGLLLVRGVVLLVDADQPEAAHRREDGRAGADDDPRLAGGDPLALVAPLGLASAPSGAARSGRRTGPEAADRLRRERDLRDEDDRAEPALERRRAGLEVDLGLAAPGRAVEEEAPAARVDRRRRSARPPPPARASAAPARLARETRPGSASVAAAGRASAGRRARARGPASSRSSRRARARGRRAPAAARRAPARRRPPRRPGGGGSSTPTTTPRTCERPNGTETTAPFPTLSSGTSYVNGRATARAETSG